MILFLRFQDFKEAQGAILNNEGDLQMLKTIHTPPEDFFCFVTQAFFTNFSQNDLQAIVVVIGPGSFTTLRTVLLFVQSIQFLKQIPVMGIYNENNRSIEALIEDTQFSLDYIKKNATEHVWPDYGSDPNITIAKHFM
ncbi:hypothetical protein CO172_03170 [Candidatus Uhrbacteria bacterium CG_4_9_14_3_um_filter_36_7]|uniref:Gcp-like domain-containing protein n=1 Tax=Candidatus Uhrbacteria bacterium CG_4_9_14_3_um_filter_36_7 TaxID=1975033 RepID=A0A2M7XGQ7_9BACT|nr:MAG: hypothetical protein CO172_03170 [Candidatus Uhrbacteria bacterium CG_4_9_14_3_um_filter_36_7]